VAVGAVGRFIGFLVGLAVVLGTLVGVFSTLVMPRASTSRLLRGMNATVRAAIWPLLRHVGTYERKDRLASVIGPLAMVLLFVMWLALLVLGFGLMSWWSSGLSLARALAISGSSVFTLGIATGIHPGTSILEVLGAGTGLLVVALEIAYLPTLYSAFSTRESVVTLLGTRAGSPAWGPEILARSHWFKTMEELPELYSTWEQWSAAVAETHTNYPSLVWFRSPASSRSWLTGLTAVMDACALHDALCPVSAPRQARLCLQMGMNCLRSLGTVLQIPYDPDPLPTTEIRLSFEEFSVGYARLEAVGFPFERPRDDAWVQFSGWRVNYESIVDRLTIMTMPPPAPWFLDRPELGPVRLPRVLDRTPDDPMAQRNPE
jgi:hypothetical protein